MAYQDHILADAAKALIDKPVYAAHLMELAKEALAGPEPYEHAFWEQIVVKPKRRQPEWYVMVGRALLIMQGVPVKSKRRGAVRSSEPWVRCALPIGEMPFPDKQIERNQLALEDGLADAAERHRAITGRAFTFDVTVETTPPGDGNLSIDELLGARKFLRDGVQVYQRVLAHDLEFVLEIGSMQAGTVCWNIAMGVGTARWPYGVDHLLLAAQAGSVEVLDERICDCERCQKAGDNR